MIKIIIKYDYLHGPLWRNNFDGSEWKTGISLVDNDEVIKTLDKSACDIYSSLYRFNEETSCEFDNEKYEIYKPALLSITHSIIDRLNQINDGSFYVDDQATESLSV